MSKLIFRDKRYLNYPNGGSGGEYGLAEYEAHILKTKIAYYLLIEVKTVSIDGYGLLHQSKTVITSFVDDNVNFCIEKAKRGSDMFFMECQISLDSHVESWCSKAAQS